MVQKLLIVVRSAGVGAVATAVDLAALVVLVSALGVPARLASVPALALGIAVQFFGNKLYAFGDRSKRWARQGAQFLAVEALGFALNLLLFDLFVSRTPLPYVVARVLSTSIVYFAVCLPLWSRIFRAELHPEGTS